MARCENYLKCDILECKHKGYHPYKQDSCSLKCSKIKSDIEYQCIPIINPCIECDIHPCPFKVR
jgi:hypothetical protein